MKLFTRFRRKSWLGQRAFEAQEMLDRAWVYLWDEFWSQASTKDRDFLIHPQAEALNLLNDLRLNLLASFMEAA